METEMSSEMLISYRNITWSHTPEDLDLRGRGTASRPSLEPQLAFYQMVTEGKAAEA